MYNIELISFFPPIFFLTLICVCVCVYLCQSVGVEVRGQQESVLCFYLWVLGIELRLGLVQAPLPDEPFCQPQNSFLSFSSLFSSSEIGFL